jgi:hypothetical protein
VDVQPGHQPGHNNNNNNNNNNIFVSTFYIDVSREYHPINVVMEVQPHTSLTSKLVGSEWSPPRPGHFSPGEIATDTDWIGGWVWPRAGLDPVEKTESRTVTKKPIHWSCNCQFYEIRSFVTVLTNACHCTHSQQLQYIPLLRPLFLFNY